MMDRTSDDQGRSLVALSDEAIEQLVHLRSGRATEVDRDAFGAWRRQSPEHEVAASEAESLWQDLAGTRAAMAHSEAREGFNSGAQREAAIVKGPPRSVLARRAVLSGGIAASLAIIVAVSGITGPISGVFATYATQPGELRKVELSDGSTAFLNSATALSVDYSAGERRLVLHSGEALFEVVADAARPFTVTAGSGEVRAVGTVFSVRHAHDRVRVMVPEGTVEVRFSEAQSDPRRVVASQQTSYDTQGIDEPTDVDIATATAWTRRKLIFNKRPLVEVVAELERHQAGWIVIADKELESLEVSGVFDLSDTGKALGTLGHILKVKVVRLPLLTVIR